jgi:Arc/MetJ-type ribon-helix-helix transcriptional regulator
MEKKMSVYIQDELFQKMEQYCQAYGVSKADFVRFSIRRALENLGLIAALSSHELLTPVKAEAR